MSLPSPDAERGRLAAIKLRALGVRGILVTAAAQGYITQLCCRMPECYCPEELGGACYFEPVGGPLPHWMPTADHYPVIKAEGGQLRANNVRLAHRLCNRVDYSIRIGRPHERDLQTVATLRRAICSVESNNLACLPISWQLFPGREQMGLHEVHTAVVADGTLTRAIHRSSNPRIPPVL
jgi:hypothetical protein